MNYLLVLILVAVLFGVWGVVVTVLVTGIVLLYFVATYQPKEKHDDTQR